MSSCLNNFDPIQFTIQFTPENTFESIRPIRFDNINDTGTMPETISDAYKNQQKH